MDLKWLQTNALTDLVNTHQIECLNLENNRLKELGHAALHNMPSLTKVDLQRNQLTRLPQDMFLGSQALQTIYLRHNQLQEIHADAFRC
jgi:Leucine-rich repeat (LRR) protein